VTCCNLLVYVEDDDFDVPCVHARQASALRAQIQEQYRELSQMQCPRMHAVNLQPLSNADDSG
jgi:hypothetical protein